MTTLHNKAEYTPGQLRVDYDGKLVTVERTGPCSHEVIAMMPAWFGGALEGHATQDHLRANAERLAHCWNCHDELLNALRALTETANNEDPDAFTMFACIEKAKAAISKASNNS